MDFLQRLEMLMTIKGVTKAQMAAGAGLGKTTVYAWWDKGYEGITLPKLRALCDYFGCTLDWLVCGDEKNGSETLSAEEKALVRAFRAADTRAREDAMNTLLNHPEKKNYEQSAM